MYKYILFDLDNTLLDFNQGEREAVKEVFASEGVIPTDKYFKRYSEINQSMWIRLERGELNKQQVLTKRFEVFFNELDIHVNPQDKEDIFRKAINQNHQLMPHAIEILNYVKSKGYVICSATNGVLHTQMTRMKDAGILEYFDHQFISEAVGYEKPQRQFFEHIIEHLKIEDLSTVLIIGDTETSDIAGGNNIGIDTVYFGNNKETNAKYHIKTLLALKEII